jgi:DNA-binding MarR family transcriptional regulator
VVRVGPDFAEEFPEADRTSTEAYASLVRTGTALLLELDRCIDDSLSVPHPAATALAVIEGAGRPLTPSEISERMLVASATMTATLDVLERRDWIERRPNPSDRRSVLVSITEAGRATTDHLLPGVRVVEREAMASLTPRERDQLLRLLAKVLARAAELAAEPPIPLEGRRNRPSRTSS